MVCLLVLVAFGVGLWLAVSCDCVLIGCAFSIVLIGVVALVSLLIVVFCLGLLND